MLIFKISEENLRKKVNENLRKSEEKLTTNSRKSYETLKKV